MPEVSTYENGTPCWIDLGVPDVEQSAAFYTALFGWEVEIGPAEIGHYSNATLRGLPVAAIADQQQPGMVFWTTYLAVDDVDATVAKVEPAGGSILVPPMDVMQFGRMAVITDAGGAQVSLWQAGEHLGAELVNEPGSLCWNELTTRAVDESLAFYAAVVGLTGVKQPNGGHGDYYELQLPGGRAVAGLMPMVGEMWPDDLPNHWMVYLAVEDADATATKCLELGGQAPVPPTDIPPGRFAVLNDPQGAHFSIIRMNETGQS